MAPSCPGVVDEEYVATMGCVSGDTEMIHVDRARVRHVRIGHEFDLVALWTSQLADQLVEGVDGGVPPRWKRWDRRPCGHRRSQQSIGAVAVAQEAECGQWSPWATIVSLGNRRHHLG